MSVVEHHRKAVLRFGELVRGVGDGQWSDPTPCAEWDVHDLVNHVTGEDLWTAPLLRGATIEEVGDRYDGDNLGDAPAKAYDAAAEEALDATAEDGVTARTVHLSYGDESAEEYLWQLFTDHLVHGWDLARATGQEETLDPELVEACAGWFAEREGMYRSIGAIGAAGEVPEDATAQDRLIAAFGRQP